MAANGRKTLGVAIVTYNSSDVLERCLASLEVAVATAADELDHPVRVVIVDNASREPPVVAARRAALDVHLERMAENLGFSPAVNIALRKLADVDLVLLLNPDARLRADSLRRLLSPFATPRAALAGPLLVDAAGRPHGVSERPFHSIGREMLRQFAPFAVSRRAFGRRAAQTGEARCLTGACLLADRRFLRDVGGLDETVRMYLEDVELCWQAHRAKRSVQLVIAACCEHDLGGSSEEVNFQSLHLHLTLLAARVEFVRRRRGRLGAAAMRTVIALGAALRSALLTLGGRGARAARSIGVFRWAVRSGRPPAWDGAES